MGEKKKNQLKTIVIVLYYNLNLLGKESHWTKGSCQLNTENEYLCDNPAVQRSLVFSADVFFLLVYPGQQLQEFQTEKVCQNWNRRKACFPIPVLEWRWEADIYKV